MGKMPRPKVSPERRQPLCASLLSRNACQHHFRNIISQEPLHTKIYRKNAAAQNLGPHFVRACAVELHFNISQKPLYTETCGKNAAPQSQPRTQTATLCEPAQSKCMPTSFQKYHFTRAAPYENLQEKCRSPEPRTTLCASPRGRTAFQHFAKATLYGNLWENAAPQSQPRTQTATLREPAQSTCMSTFHKSHFTRKFTREMLRPRVSTLINYRPLHLPQEPLSVDTLLGE